MNPLQAVKESSEIKSNFAVVQADKNHVYDYMNVERAALSMADRCRGAFPQDKVIVVKRGAYFNIRHQRWTRVHQEAKS